MQPVQQVSKSIWVLKRSVVFFAFVACFIHSVSPLVMTSSKS